MTILALLNIFAIVMKRGSSMKLSQLPRKAYSTLICKISILSEDIFRKQDQGASNPGIKVFKINILLYP